MNHDNGVIMNRIIAEECHGVTCYSNVHYTHSDGTSLNTRERCGR